MSLWAEGPQRIIAEQDPVTLAAMGEIGTVMTRRVAIDVLLENARRGIARVQPADLASEMAAGALVVDTRPVDQRQRDGELPGALIIDRNVLEWRLDPTCPHHIPEADNANVRVVIVCNEGYSSSLAAATLRQLGLERAADLVGGFQAWKRFTAQAGDAQASVGSRAPELGGP
jgi:rhodanese-related sulfurtransferase